MWKASGVPENIFSDKLGVADTCPPQPPLYGPGASPAGEMNALMLKVDKFVFGTNFSFIFSWILATGLSTISP